MTEPQSTVATTLKTTFVAGSGIAVWGLSLNEWAAILSIILLVTTICEKWGITGWVQKKLNRAFSSKQKDCSEEK